MNISENRANVIIGNLLVYLQSELDIKLNYDLLIYEFGMTPKEIDCIGKYIID